MYIHFSMISLQMIIKWPTHWAPYVQISRLAALLWVHWWIPPVTKKDGRQWQSRILNLLCYPPWVHRNMDLHKCMCRPHNTRTHARAPPHPPTTHTHWVCFNYQSHFTCVGTEREVMRQLQKVTWLETRERTRLRTVGVTAKYETSFYSKIF